MTEKTTVGELRAMLKHLPDNATVEFAGGLSLYRIRWQDDDSAYFEFNEFEAELSEGFRKKHPTVLVAFCGHDLDESPVSVSTIPRL